MKDKKVKSGSVRISPDVLKDAKKLCIDLEINIQEFVDAAVREKVTKEQRKIYARI